MKIKIIFTVAFLAFALFHPQANAANSTLGPIGSSLAHLTVGDVLTMKASEYVQLTNQKLSLKERLIFGLIKGEVKRGLRKGTLTLNDPIAEVAAAAEGSFNFGAFALGFLLGIIGLAIVLLAFKDKEAWRSALYGWAAAIVIILLVVLL